ncbi:MAG TPA: metallophosphoesterase [Thermoplasmata archaeon]|nr:metallophosphoesterase [Thermoplasmata archaeon]
MHEIVCVGDVHEGLSFDFRIDPETGISERALDLHGNFAKAAQWAIEHEASLFCILGDLFDRTHVAPVFREMVRQDVIEPLGAAGIEVWILAGNHDQPRRAARATSLDDYRGYAHVRVFREPKAEVREIDGRKVGFILLPYLHPEQVVERVRQLGNDVSREDAYPIARELWKEWIHTRADELRDADLRILFGHFEFQGVRYASTTPPEVVPNDFTFTPDMVPDAVDLVVFGHIHMHQAVGRKIVYAGAPERIDWGERLDPKGFLAIRPDGGWSFVELPARPMDKVEVTVNMADDVTEKVLEALPQENAGHLVRIEITIPDELRSRLDEKRLADRLRDAFHFEVKFLSSSRPRIAAEEFTLDPGRLLAEYVDKVLADHPKREAIKVEAQRVLKEALG